MRFVTVLASALAIFGQQLSPSSFAASLASNFESECNWKGELVMCDLAHKMPKDVEMNVLDNAQKLYYSTHHWGRTCDHTFHGIQMTMITLTNPPFDPNYENMRSFNKKALSLLHPISLCETELVVTALIDSGKVFIYRRSPATRVLSEHTMGRIQDIMAPYLSNDQVSEAFNSVIDFFDEFMLDREHTVLIDWVSVGILFSVMSIMYYVAWVMWMKNVFVFDARESNKIMMLEEFSKQSGEMIDRDQEGRRVKTDERLFVV